MADEVTFSRDLASILTASDLDDAERAVSDERERPGVWLDYPRRRADPLDPDGRTLTQEDTNALIVRELIDTELLGENRAQLKELFGEPAAVRFERHHRVVDALAQRGGLHSEPLVRLLAYRAWGNRDRGWHDLARRKDAAIALLASDADGDIDLEVLFGGTRAELLRAHDFGTVSSWVATVDDERWWFVAASRGRHVSQAARTQLDGDPVAIAQRLLADVDSRLARLASSF